MKLIKENKILLEQVIVTKTFTQKFVGLLNKKRMNPNEGLLIKNCNWIHSFGMKFNFDAIFLDKHNKIVCIIENIKPNKIMPIIFKAKNVLETKQGFAKDHNLKPKDKLELSR